MDKTTIEIVANVVTILGFPLTIVGVIVAVIQLQKNNKSIDTFAQTINLQQKFLANIDKSIKIRDITINNVTKAPKKRYNRGN